MQQEIAEWEWEFLDWKIKNVKKRKHIWKMLNIYFVGMMAMGKVCQ